MGIFRRVPVPSDEERDEQRRSQAELAAGRLPLSAQRRLAEQNADHAWTSDLESRDLTALRAAGWEPVGQAFGASTYQISNSRLLTAQAHPGYSNLTGARINTAPVELRMYHAGEAQSRRRALTRLRAEASALGADGVIGLRIHSSVHGTISQWQAIGTAVRQRGGAPLSGAPFVTPLGAADLGALLRGGWRPATLITEITRFLVHDGSNAGGPRFLTAYMGNQEVPQYTEVMTMARERMRARLQAPLNAENGTGLLLHHMNTRLEHEECTRYEGAHDAVVDIDVLATVITRSGAPSVAAGARLDMMTVLPLD
jgi:uncharacterized protein YbjQ (UPF0145 family)